MALIINKIGQFYSKQAWINNFEIVQAMLNDLGNKINSNKIGANNGLASLNAGGKVVQTALNAEKLDGKTYAEWLVPTTLEGNINLKGERNNGSYFLPNMQNVTNLPAEVSREQEAWLDVKKVGNSMMITLSCEDGIYKCFKASGDDSFGAWIS